MLPEKFNIEVAGVSCAIQLNEIKIAQEFKSEFSNFLTKKNPQIEINGFFHPDEFESLKSLDPGETKEVSFVNVKDGLAEVFNSFSKGTFDLKTGKGKINFVMPVLFRNFVRICYALSLLEKKALVLHSSGVLVGDRAVLFSGSASAGKSTIMGLAGRPYLNEEANILKLENDRVMVHTTPFGGLVKAKKLKKPLGRVFFINQSRKTFQKSISLSEKLSHLMNNEFLSMALIFKENPKTTKKLFALITDFSTCIEAKELHFQKNDSFTRFLV